MHNSARNRRKCVYTYAAYLCIHSLCIHYAASQLLVHTQRTRCVCTTQREVDENVYTQAAIDENVYTQAMHFCVYTKANAYGRSIFATVHA